MTVKTLLDFIARFESRGDYRRVWGGIRKEDHPPRSLTRMTVQEVLNWQDSIDRKYNSEAAGRYQIMEDTLRGMAAGDPDLLGKKFNKKTQDELATRLLRRRGLANFITGDMTVERFGKRVAQEWASMPVLTATQGRHRFLDRGMSYYAGDGLNKAHAPVDGYTAALLSVRGKTKTPKKARKAPKQRWWHRWFS